MAETNQILNSLASRAALTPSRIAVSSPGGSLTCLEAESLSNQAARSFQKIGLKKSSRAALLVTPGPEMIVMAFGLIKIGAVPIMIDPGIGRKNFKACIDQAEPVAFLGIPAAHLARLLFGWGRKSIRINIIAGPSIPGLGTGLNTLIKTESPSVLEGSFPGPDDMAAIVFTSGSTGPSKGVVYTHRMFQAQAEMLKKQFEIKAGEIDLATFPLFAMFDPYWETQTIFPAMDYTRPGKVNPAGIVDTIRKNSATHMFGSPALLNRVSAYGIKHGIKLPSLRRVFSAGAPVPDKVIRRTVKMLGPEAVLHTPYGATEALPVTTIDHNELLELREKRPPGSGTCIGRCLPGVSLEIIKISDEPISSWDQSLLVEPGEIGELVVHGDNVSRSYYRRPEADRLAKIPSPDGRLRHRMGDLGYIDREGRVWFCGRKSHRVITGEGELYSVPAEGVFNQHPAVFRSALVGIGNPPHQEPVICVELKSGSGRKRAEKKNLARELLAAATGHHCCRGISNILFHPGFPVDVRHNSKISREKLAVWASKQLGRSEIH